MSKLFCILEQGREINDSLTIKHINQFNTSFSDFYRLNWYTKDDSNANWYAQDITLSEGKNILYQNVPKIYKYYIFIDDDVDVKIENIHDNHLTVAEKLRDMLNRYNPLHATLYRKREAWGSWHVHNIKDLHDKYRREAWPICGFDLDCDIYHTSFAEVVFPIKYHGCYKCLSYAQYICYKLYPEKQIMMSGLTIENTRCSNHDQELALPQAKNGCSILESFLLDLKPCPMNENALMILGNQYLIPNINAGIYLNFVNDKEVIFDTIRLGEILN